MSARRPGLLTGDESSTIAHIQRLVLQLSRDRDSVNTFVSAGFNARGTDNSFIAAVLATDYNNSTPLSILHGPYIGANREDALSGLLGGVEGEMYNTISQAGVYLGGQKGQV
ncbi:hypothetical protein PMIN04_007318 [Paraphaeosphaeria minitans]